MVRLAESFSATGGNCRCSSAGSIWNEPEAPFTPEILPVFNALDIVAVDTPAALAACPAVYFMLLPALLRVLSLFVAGNIA
jgi:hypothetical protein